MAINNLAALGYGTDATRMMPASIDQQYKDTISGFQGALANQQALSNNISGGYEKLYARTMGNLQGYGQSQYNDLQDQRSQELARAQNSAASRGMWNTSAYDSNLRAANQDAYKRQAVLQDQLKTQYLNADQNITGQLLNYQAQAAQNQYGMAANIMGAQQHRADQGLGFYGQQQGLEQQNANRMLQADQFNAQYGQQNQQFAQNMDFQKAKWYGYSQGGAVPGYGSGDTVPAKLTPGEFVLSKDMIAGLEDGSLDTFKLRNMIRQGRMSPGMPMEGYARGGFVPSRTPSAYLMNLGTAPAQAYLDPRYPSRGRYG